MKQAQKLRNGDDGMGVVELEAPLFGQCFEVPSRRLAAVHDVLQRGAGHEILLPEAQDLPHHRVVVGVQNVGDLGRVEVLVCLDFPLHLVEGSKVERLNGFRLPEPERVDDAVAVAEHGHVVGNGAHRLVGEPDEDGVAVHPDAPGIPPLEPVVPFLVLIAVFERLAEEPVAVADTVAVEGDVLARGSIEIAGGEAPEPPVAEGGVLHLLELCKVLAHALQSLARFLEDPEVEQVGIDGAPHQKFCREVPAAAAPRTALFAPVRIRLLHDRLGDGVI